MATWIVDVPFVGYLSIEVKADTKEAAMDEAMEDPRSLGDHIEAGSLTQWEMVRQVTRGNVCYAPLNDISAEETDE